MNIFGQILQELGEFVNSLTDDKKYNEKLVKQSDSCRSLIYRYNQSIEDGKPIMTKAQLKIELLKIVKDPEEQRRIQQKHQRQEEYNERTAQERRDKRKIGYKYELEIFKIFDVNRELDIDTLYQSIDSHFQFNRDYSKFSALFELWEKNGLVTRCSWDRSHFEVGPVLEWKLFSIDESDLTREKWLVSKNKTLLPYSKKYHEYHNRGHVDEDDMFNSYISNQYDD